MSTTEDLLRQIDQMLDEMDRGSTRPSHRERPAESTESPTVAPVVEAPPQPAAEVEAPPVPVQLPPPAPAPVEPARTPEEPVPASAPELEPGPEIPAVRGRRRRRGLWRAVGRELRFVALLALACALGSGGALVYRALDRPGASAPPGPAAAPPPEQHVATWAVWPHAQRDVTFVTVLASGGDRDPLALVVPPYLALNVPGQGFGPLEEAAAGRDPELVATSVGNVLQVPVDSAIGSGPEEIVALVDSVGGVPSPEGTLDGAGAARYLSEKDTDPSDRFIRWQEVLSGILEGLDLHPGALASAPEPLRDALAGLGGSDASILELPAQDIGAGLADVDEPELERLVGERFLRPGTTADDVRLLVLNGNGRPGVGADVARLLVPIGFRLVSSQNASGFDEKVTLIVAASEEFLDEAELARSALGVGEVVLGEQPTRVTDVSVIVGRDFRRP